MNSVCVHTRTKYAAPLAMSVVSPLPDSPLLLEWPLRLASWLPCKDSKCKQSRRRMTAGEGLGMMEDTPFSKRPPF